MVSGHVNIRDIAEAAGISIASVSRALQDPPSPKVSEELRNRILRLCEEMHYEPNAHIRRMFSHCSDTVAIIFPGSLSLSSDVAGDAVDANLCGCMLGAQEVLSEHGYGLLLHELSDSFLSRKEYLRLVRSKAVDGILVWGALRCSPWVKELSGEGIPLIMLQTYVTDISCPYVIADEGVGVKSLVARVVDAGHRQIGYAPAPESASAGCLRNAAVHEALRSYGLELCAEYGEGGYGYAYGRRSAEWMLSCHPEVTCIMHSNDMAAWGCLDVARERGFRVPRDLSVVGGDGLVFPGDSKITSYHLPSREIGRRGAELLLSMIRGERVPLATVLPVSSVAGNTLASAPVDSDCDCTLF